MNNKSEPEGRRDADQSRKPRTQLQKNSEFFEKLEQLEQKISALEKDRNTPLYSRRSEFRKDYCELEEFDLKGTNDRKSEIISQIISLQKQEFQSWQRLGDRCHFVLQRLSPPQQIVVLKTTIKRKRPSLLALGNEKMSA